MDVSSLSCICAGSALLGGAIVAAGHMPAASGRKSVDGDRREPRSAAPIVPILLPATRVPARHGFYAPRPLRLPSSQLRRG